MKHKTIAIVFFTVLMSIQADALKEGMRQNQFNDLLPLYEECVTPYNQINITGSTVFCSGSYTVHNIYIRSDNIVLDCNQSYLHGAYFGVAIFIEGRTNVTIKNCRIYGYNYGLIFQNTTQSQASGNMIWSSWDSAIVAENSNQNTFMSNQLTHNAYQNGIHINGGFGNAIINNTIINNGYTGSWSHRGGIALINSNNSRIISNIVDKNKPYGIYSVLSSGNVIENNSISNNTKYGIYALNVYNSVIGYNNITYNNYTGIFMNQESNIIQFNNVHHNQHYNLYLSGQGKAIAENNWWGTTDCIEINDKIFDKKDNPSIGTVDYSPFLSEPYPDGGQIYCYYSISLHNGWNLISSPLSPINKTMKNILQGVNYSAIYSYDNGNYTPVDDSDEIDLAKGYWVKANEDYNLSINGEEITNPLLNLKLGYNLVSYPLLVENNISYYDDSVTDILTYDESWQSYSPYKDNSLNTLITLKPGKGYFVKVDYGEINEAVQDFLIELSKNTFNYLSSDWATNNHLPWSWRSGQSSSGDYANPTEIGFYILSYIGAYEMKQPWSPSWNAVESEITATLNQLEAWQNGSQVLYGPHSYNNSVFYRSYWISWNPPRVGGGSYDHEVPSIDNAWLAASLITIGKYAEANGKPVLAEKTTNVLKDMNFRIWYDSNTHLFKMGAANEPNGGPYWDYYSNENRIINFVAHALGQMNDTEFIQSLNALTQNPSSYDGITVEKVNWDGSYFTYTTPALFIKEMETPYGVNTINQATSAQIRYANDMGYPYFGISDCFDVELGDYVKRGAPPRGSSSNLTDPDTGLITPHASALALITSYKAPAATTLHSMSAAPLYNKSYGFLDSIDISNNKTSYRFSGLDQEWIFLSLMNYFNQTIWTYFYMDKNVSETHKLMFG